MTTAVANRVSEPEARVPRSETVTFRVHPAKLRVPNVAILGFTDHRKQAFDLPHAEWERWGLNELHRFHDVKEFDRWFEIHKRPDIEGGDPEAMKQLAAFDIPVYMQDHYTDIPPSLPFPKQFVEGAVGDYMTSSPAWMLGLAIAMGAKKIGLFGIDMAQETEYAQQRPCVEYLIGMARGRGIKVIVPDTSDLLKAIGQYGFGATGSLLRDKLTERATWLNTQDNAVLAQLRSLDTKRAEVEAKMHAEHERMDNEYHEKRETLLAQRFQFVGAMENCRYLMRSWAISGDSKGEFTPDRSQDPQTGILPSADNKATEA